MKTLSRNLKLIFFVGALALFLISPLYFAQAQTTNFWLLGSGPTLKPVGSTWSLTVPQLGGTGIRCVQVDNSGLFAVALAGCGSGSGGFPFLSDTNYGALSNSTTSPVWFKVGLQASSTSFFSAFNSTYGTTTFASSTAFTTTNLAFGNGTSTGSLAIAASSTIAGNLNVGGTLAITGLSQVPLYVNSSGAVSSAGSGTSGNCVKWGASNTLADALAACGSGSGGTWFVPDSYNLIGVNSTSTALWLKGTSPFSLIATSTYATFASSTVESVTGNSYFGTSVANSILSVGATTTPYAKLTIVQGSLDTLQTLFVISSSTASATSTLFIVNNSGMVGIGTSSPQALWALNASSTTGIGGTNMVLSISSSSLATTTSFLTLNNTNVLSVGNNGSGILTVDGSNAGTTTISNLSTGNLNFDLNAGVVNLSDLPVDSTAIASTTESQSISIGGLPILTVYAQSNGKGSIMNTGVGIGTTSPFALLALFASNLASSTSNNLFMVASTTQLGATSTAFLIDNVGRVGVGTSTLTNAFFSVHLPTTTIPLTSSFVVASTSPSGAVSTLFNLTNTGTLFLPLLTQSGSTQTYYACGAATTFEMIWDTTTCLVSALKFKQNVQSLELGLDTVLAMKPVTYFNKDPNFGTRQQIGFIADWSVKQVPQLITYDNKGDIHGFNYEQYTAVLTKAIQELNDKVEGKTVVMVRSATDNWQWFAIGFLVLWNLYLTFRKRR